MGFRRCGVGGGWGSPGCLRSDCPPSVPPTGYQIAYRLASSSPDTFTTVEVGATVRQFTATELAPESAYVFRLSAKTRQGWGEPLEATVITTEKRGEAWRPRSAGGAGQRAASWLQAASALCGLHVGRQHRDSRGTCWAVPAGGCTTHRCPQAGLTPRGKGEAPLSEAATARGAEPPA